MRDPFQPPDPAPHPCEIEHDWEHVMPAYEHPGYWKCKRCGACEPPQAPDDEGGIP